jgi:hypothetical protein
MAYISASELATYLLDNGFVDEAIDTAVANRLLNSSVQEWERLVGVVPFQALSTTIAYDVRDVQADRRGWILDLPTPLSAVPTLVKSGVETGNVGITFVQWTDFEMPTGKAPWTQIIFRNKPQTRLEITGAFGYMASSDIGDLVNEAICLLASARCIEEGAGKTGIASRVKTGLVEISTPDNPVTELRKRAKTISMYYRLP